MSERTCVALLLLSLSAVADPQSLRLKDVAVYAPAPEYPFVARKRAYDGQGLFVCKVRPDGSVASVDVLQSTGHAILDDAGIAAFSRWRFRPGALTQVKIPLRFTRGGVKTRIAGSVVRW